MKGRVLNTGLLVLAVSIFFVSGYSRAAVDDFAVPPSLMLHSHSVEFLPGFLDLLEKDGYTTITYKDLNDFVISGQSIPDKLIIISIDDYGPNRITHSLKLMAEELMSRGMVAVIGLVPGQLSEAEWKYLDSLERAGFEIASHTSSHKYLPGQPDNILREEISGSYATISEHLESPVSLILPYGVYGDDLRILAVAQETGYSFVVGIPNGEWFTQPAPYYVGRGSPVITSAAATLTKLESRFTSTVIAKERTLLQLSSPLASGTQPH
ncbi:polysaccharide deacetylase family protein [candidate division WWE3 bacterium]|uniref:Polysaccharide deacetylase family protein n=1 Tax=candidate division WWE3 bacterium TaxID=2053526 RepID=A0A3A4ZFD4_UNCKA|nr:MAG: polysaccharide deacetylase family protein [candidate division WWE3 bacterium]